MPQKKAKTTKAKSVKKKAKPTKKVAAKKVAPANKIVSTGFWLLKSEPESYSIDRFAEDRKTLWTGVRNYLARNFMVDVMKLGDRFFFYHSNAEPSAIVGLGEITKINQPDPTALEKDSDYYDPKASKDHPIWFCAEVSFLGKLKSPLSLNELKNHPELAKMALLQRGQRLSVMPVTAEEWNFILRLANKS